MSGRGTTESAAEPGKKQDPARRHERHASALTVRVESLTGDQDDALADGIDTEVADIARFLGVPAAHWEWATGL